MIISFARPKARNRGPCAPTRVPKLLPNGISWGVHTNNSVRAEPIALSAIHQYASWQLSWSWFRFSQSCVIRSAREWHSKQKSLPCAINCSSSSAETRNNGCGCRRPIAFSGSGCRASGRNGGPPFASSNLRLSSHGIAKAFSSTGRGRVALAGAVHQSRQRCAN